METVLPQHGCLDPARSPVEPVKSNPGWTGLSVTVGVGVGGSGMTP